MRPLISIRGYVCPSAGRSVGRSVCVTGKLLLKMQEKGGLIGATYVVHAALYSTFFLFLLRCLLHAINQNTIQLLSLKMHDRKRDSVFVNTRMYPHSIASNII